MGKGALGGHKKKSRSRAWVGVGGVSTPKEKELGEEGSPEDNRKEEKGKYGQKREASPQGTREAGDHSKEK